jgi:hypothetical protein
MGLLMTEPKKDRFSRLLAACEQLTRDETAALSRRNFDTLTRTQHVKSAILADLAVEAGAKAPHSEARARLTGLLKKTQENQLALANLKAATSEKLRLARASARRLHTLRPAYGSARGSREQAFYAHG